MNLNDTLDPQIADTLLRRPSLDDLSRFVAGLATPIEAELIEAHMQRSPEVRMDVEALKEDFDALSESLHQNFRQQEREAASHRIGAHESDELALAAATSEERPEVLYLVDHIPDIPSDLEGDASASPEAPSLCSSLRLAWKSSPSEPPFRIVVSWPTGKRHTPNWLWDESGQEWRTDVVLPEPWSKTSDWLQNGKLQFVI